MTTPTEFLAQKRNRHSMQVICRYGAMSLMIGDRFFMDNLCWEVIGFVKEEHLAAVRLRDTSDVTALPLRMVAELVAELHDMEFDYHRIW